MRLAQESHAQLEATFCIRTAFAMVA